MFSEDFWLSKTLGMSSFKMTEPTLLVSEQDLKDKDFIYVKLQINEQEKINHLIRLNFSIIETNITLKSCKINLLRNKEIQCRFANIQDEEELKKIASESFEHSRFHMDKKISNVKANYLKAEWVSSFFKGLRGEWMIVAEYDGKLCGFLQLIKDDNNIIIDLIAVKKDFQGKDIGKSMIKYAFKNCATGNSIFIVGTQLTNLKSIRFYNNIGFHITNSKYILHYHK